MYQKNGDSRILLPSSRPHPWGEFAEQLSTKPLERSRAYPHVRPFAAASATCCTRLKDIDLRKSDRVAQLMLSLSSDPARMIEEPIYEPRLHSLEPKLLFFAVFGRRGLRGHGHDRA